MTSYRRKRKALADINVVPYIDVMLVLLIVFMVTAPMLMPGIDVNLPVASSNALPTKEQDPIIISVDASGNYYINTLDAKASGLSLQEIVALLQVQVNKNPSQPPYVLIKGDRAVAYGKVIAIMDIIKSSGINNVGLLTESAYEQLK